MLVVYCLAAFLALPGMSKEVERWDAYLETIGKEPEGKLLLEHVEARFPPSKPMHGAIKEILRWGGISQTDTSLTETSAHHKGISEQVVIQIKENQPVFGIQMDLVHELVHAGAKGTVDIFDPSLRAWKYIYSGIEGEGGEIDAVWLECLLGLRWAKASPMPHLSKLKRCERYVVEGVLSRDKIREDYYRLGRWHAFFEKKMKEDLARFPYLSKEVPLLVSSVSQTPYFIALLREYEGLTAKVCRQIRGRLSLQEPTDQSAWSKRLRDRELLKQRCFD